MWYVFWRFWVQMVFTIFFRIQVTGQENVPQDGGVILASNHQSYLDPMLVGAVLKRPLHFMARKSLFQKFFLFTWLIRSVNAFPVDRERGEIGAVRQALRCVESGEALLGFPEATRTHTGQLGKLKHGLFVIAARAEVPVVPTLIQGAYEAWPRTRLLPKPSQISVVFGKALMPSDFGGNADAMAEACSAALAELQAGARELARRTRK